MEILQRIVMLLFVLENIRYFIRLHRKIGKDNEFVSQEFRIKKTGKSDIEYPKPIIIVILLFLLIGIVIIRQIIGDL